MADVPEVVQYGQVVGRFVQFLADSSDPSAVPDEVPLSGTILLSPNVNTVQWPTATPPRMAVVSTIECMTDLGGNLVTKDGQLVWVVASDQPNGEPDFIQWTAQFRFDGVVRNPPNVVFNVPAGGAVDLSIVVPAAPQTGVVTVVSHQDALDAAASAAAAAMAAADAEAVSSDASRLTMGTVADARLPMTAQAATLAETYTAKANVILNARDYGVVGDGATDDTAAIAAFTAVLAARRAALGLRSIAGLFPAGRYLTDRFAVPGGVCLLGEGKDATRLVNTSTDGLVFVHFDGSNSYAERIDFDGQRAAQATLGLATVQFARLNAPTGGGTNISGGVTLTAGVSAASTSIAVGTDSPAGEDIVAGDVITLVEGAAYEMVRVAESYTGGLIIALESPISQAFTVDAKVSVAATNVGIRDCRVRGNGRDGVAFWHAIHAFADDNTIVDFEDSGIDMPSAGCRFVKARRNTIVTKGRWGIAFDTAETEFGRTADCTSEDNTVRFLPGGSFVNGNTVDGIYFGQVDRCHSINDTLDLTGAGVSGVRYQGSAIDCTTINVRVIGPPTVRASTSGIRYATTPAAGGRMRVIGGTISKMTRGVDIAQGVGVVITGTTILDSGAHGIDTTANAATPQRISISAVQVSGGVNGIRFGGAPTTGNKVTVTGCIVSGHSGSAYPADAGWNFVSTGNIP